jgi:hypothetical protein
VIAMPASSGRPLRRNGRSARANTNGSTGRMQGLRMVRKPQEIGEEDRDQPWPEGQRRPLMQWRLPVGAGRHRTDGPECPPQRPAVFFGADHANRLDVAPVDRRPWARPCPEARPAGSRCQISQRSLNSGKSAACAGEDAFAHVLSSRALVNGALRARLRAGHGIWQGRAALPVRRASPHFEIAAIADCCREQIAVRPATAVVPNRPRKRPDQVHA